MVLVQPTGARYLGATADATFVRDELTCDPGLATSQTDLAGVIMHRGLCLLMAGSCLSNDAIHRLPGTLSGADLLDAANRPLKRRHDDMRFGSARPLRRTH